MVSLALGDHDECPSVDLGQADDATLRQARGMTTPEPENPQPRDIALEQETPEQAADLEEQSRPAADDDAS